MEGPGVRSNGRSEKRRIGIVQHRIDVKEHVDLVVLKFVNHSFDHGDGSWVQGQIYGADGLHITRRQVFFCIVSNGYELLQNQIHFGFQEWEKFRDTP